MSHSLSILSNRNTLREMEGGWGQDTDTHTTGMSVCNLLATPTKDIVSPRTERVMSRSRSTSMVVSPTFGDPDTLGKRGRDLVVKARSLQYFYITNPPLFGIQIHRKLGLHSLSSRATQWRARPSHSCDGWVGDLGVVGTSSIFGLVRGTGSFVVVLPTFVLVSRIHLDEQYRGHGHFLSASSSGLRSGGPRDLYLRPET